MLKLIKIFTDGSCLGNPGPGGYGVILHYKQFEKVFSMGYYTSTNNRMELMAAIVALEALNFPCEIIFYTDSQYVRQGITQWMVKWKECNWRTANRQPVKNVDLWKRLDIAVRCHEITWEWIKGHAGYIYNERCDILARNAAHTPSRKDFGYQYYD